MAQIISKNGKIIGLIYILTSLLVLILALTFSSQFIIFPSFASPQLVEATKLQLKKTNDLFLLITVVAFVIVAIKSIINVHNRRQFKIFHLCFGIIVTIIPIVIVIISFLSTLESYNAYQVLYPLVIDEIKMFDWQVAFSPGFTMFYIAYSVLGIFLLVSFLNITYFICRFKAESEEKVVE